MVVRVEDTDQDRLVPGALDGILDGLRWLDLNWDEGPEVGGPYAPYFQSQRLDLYRTAVKSLIDNGKAYNCYCSKELLGDMRREQSAHGLNPRYDRRCRNLSVAELRHRQKSTETSVVRFKMPSKCETSVDDLIRGHVTWQNELLDDIVLLKSDGYPTYHLANVVDDHMMKITHVLRAEEWLPSTPSHINLYEALGYSPPSIGHLPMILGRDRSKLSKRHGATSILEYRDDGFLPDAMVNFMVLLGWSLDEKTDIISREELVENFSLERIGKSGAIFDREKLLWMNGVYLRKLNPEDLVRLSLPFLDRPIGGDDSPVRYQDLGHIMPLVQERMKTLKDAASQTRYFFQDDLNYESDKLVQKGLDREQTCNALRWAMEALESLTTFEANHMEDKLRSLCDEMGFSPRQLFGALRVATTGRDASPPLFQTMEALGSAKSLKRIRAAILLLTDN
jgi:glutamyl-tRNA synthetase